MSAWRGVRAHILLYRSLRCYPRLNSFRFLANDIDKDAPVKFSESAASGWKASFSRAGVEKEDVSAWFQPYVVIASLSTFLIYFCILREENDIDELLSLTLYDRIEGLEKVQLELSLKYNLDHNLPTDAIKKRLGEIEAEEIRLEKIKSKDRTV